MRDIVKINMDLFNDKIEGHDTRNGVLIKPRQRWQGDKNGTETEVGERKLQKKELSKIKDTRR